MIKLVVFDFDGTIADSFGVILAAFEELVPQQQKITQNDIEVLRNKPYKDILNHFHISIMKVPGLVIKGRAMLNKSIEKVKPFPGVDAALKQLHDAGYQLAIISSNSPRNIQRFLEKYDLHEFFEKVQGNVGLLGKTTVINGLIRKHGCKADEVVYVGDEPRDIDAAHKARVHSVAVTWGFIGASVLETHAPSIMIDRPNDLVKAVATF